MNMNSKQEEIELTELRNKVEVETSKQKESENMAQYMSRTESLKKMKETEQDKKETQKNLLSISRLEASITKQLDRIEKIISDLVSNIQTSTLIGLDFNKNEYWVSELIIYHNESN